MTGLLRKRSQTQRRALLTLALYGVVVLGPLFTLCWSLLSGFPAHYDELVAVVLLGNRQLGLIANSIGLALVVAVCSTGLGWCAALAITSARGGVGPALLWACLPLAALPPSLYATVWLAAVPQLNTALATWSGPTISPFGWQATVLIQSISLLPISVGSALLGLRSVDPMVLEAGRVLQNDLFCLRKVIVPLSAPAIITGMALVFVMSLSDYSIPSLLQVPVYAMEVFAEFGLTRSPSRTLLLTWPILLTCWAALALVIAPLRAITQQDVQRLTLWGTTPRWPRWFQALLAATTGVVLAGTLAVFLTLAVLSRTPAQFWRAVVLSLPDVLVSLSIAAGAVAISLPIALAVAWALYRIGEQPTIWWFLIVAPLATPASLIGIGWLSVGNLIGQAPTVLSALLPSLACATRFTPFATLVLLAQLRRLPWMLFEAALILQPNWWRRFWSVEIPLLTPGLLAAAGVVFAASLGELGATIMVIPPGQSTLTLRIYNYLHYGASEVVAGVCLLLVVIMLTVSAMTIYLGRRRYG